MTTSSAVEAVKTGSESVVKNVGKDLAGEGRHVAAGTAGLTTGAVVAVCGGGIVKALGAAILADLAVEGGFYAFDLFKKANAEIAKAKKA